MHLAPATLRSWVAGRPYPTRGGTGRFQPLIRLPTPGTTVLSFANLVEAHVLWALRVRHRVPIKAVRTAIHFAERELGIKRLLLRPNLRAHAGELLLDKYGELLNLSKSGQFAMRKVLEGYLERLEWANSELPVRLYPFVQSERLDGRRTVVIDSALAFGRPVVHGKGVTTGIIADRLDAGETVEEIMSDYDLGQEEVEEAVLYERAA